MAVSSYLQWEIILVLKPIPGRGNCDSHVATDLYVYHRDQCACGSTVIQGCHDRESVLKLNFLFRIHLRMTISQCT